VLFHGSPVRFGRAQGLALAACIALLAGCSKKNEHNPVQPLPVETVAPDFALQDVNPNSFSHNRDISPRSRLGKISAWYFGHAT
jgi:hypothetical protein